MIASYSTLIKQKNPVLPFSRRMRPFGKTFLYHMLLNPIWTGGGGGGKMASLRVFAKYLKNSLANLYETLRLLRPIYRSIF